jgi:hypothetical protein
MKFIAKRMVISFCAGLDVYNNLMLIIDSSLTKFLLDLP